MQYFSDISYLSHTNDKQHTIDVYLPDGDSTFPVAVFIHGGTWFGGGKDIYTAVGKNMTDKGVVTVVVRYRLGEQMTYFDRATDCSAAIQWIVKHIRQYKGQAENIFLAGHSVGGHLAALISLNKKFLGEEFIAQHLKGCILIDAFGLNMDYVMHHHLTFFSRELQKVFTDIPGNWIDAAPVHYIDNTVVPFLILTGSDTYPYLTLDNAVFMSNLDRHNIPNEQHTLSNKNHHQMGVSLQNNQDEAYGWILEFIWGRV
jgi:acetyl esterase/lipase